MRIWCGAQVSDIKDGAVVSTVSVQRTLTKLIYHQSILIIVITDS
jgi:hypothetical protein